MAELKTKPTGSSVEAFIDRISDATRRADSLRLLELYRGVTKQEPAMWGPSIVGFGSYHYRYDSGREGDFMRAGFSPRANALTLYIMPGLDGFEPLLEKLGKHKTGRCCLYIKKLDDIHLPTLKKLIRASLDRMKRMYPE